MKKKIYNATIYLRASEWIDSKVPFMLGALIYCFIFGNNKIDITKFYLQFFLYALYVSFFLAFSYVLNDYFDIEADAAVGKRKIMHSLDRRTVVFSMVILVTLGVVPLGFFVSEVKVFYFISIVIYLFGAAYSAPFLSRFKEKGMVGLVECSVAQRCLPLIPITLLVNVPFFDFVILLLLSLCNGLRYILIHQVVDYENDRIAGIKTYVSQGANNYRKLIVICTGVEVVWLLFLAIKMIQVFHLIAIVIPLYILFEKIIHIFVTKYMQIDWMTSFLAVPLEALYNVFFPLLNSCILLVLDAKFIGILVFVVVLTKKSLQGKLAFIKTYFQVNTQRGARNDDR